MRLDDTIHEAVASYHKSASNGGGSIGRERYYDRTLSPEPLPFADVRGLTQQ